MDFDGPGPFGPFAHFGMVVIGGLLWLFMLLVAIALIFLLVRYLLVATKAHQLYIAQNTPPAAAPTVSAPAATSAAPTVSAPAPKPAPTTKPAPKPRTPKTP